MNRIGDIQLQIQEYRSKLRANDSDLANDILLQYEQLLYEFKQQNDMINQIMDVFEKEKQELVQQTLDPLEQILYSCLLGIRSLEAEVQSDSVKEYLQTLKAEVEVRLKNLKQTSIAVYPICMQDLGALDAIKSFYEMSKSAGRMRVDVQFYGDIKRYDDKVETYVFRTIQYLLKVINMSEEIKAVTVTVKEKRGQILIVLEGDQLVNQLQHVESFQVLELLLKKIDPIELTYKKQQLHVNFNV